MVTREEPTLRPWTGVIGEIEQDTFVNIWYKIYGTEAPDKEVEKDILRRLRMEIVLIREHNQRRLKMVRTQEKSVIISDTLWRVTRSLCKFSTRFFPMEWELPRGCCRQHEYSKDFPEGRWIVILESRYSQLPIILRESGESLIGRHLPYRIESDSAKSMFHNAHRFFRKFLGDVIMTLFDYSIKWIILDDSLSEQAMLRDIEERQREKTKEENQRKRRIMEGMELTKNRKHLKIVGEGVVEIENIPKKAPHLTGSARNYPTANTSKAHCDRVLSAKDSRDRFRNAILSSSSAVPSTSCSKGTVEKIQCDNNQKTTNDIHEHRLTDKYGYKKRTVSSPSRQLSTSDGIEIITISDNDDYSASPSSDSDPRPSSSESISSEGSPVRDRASNRNENQQNAVPTSSQEAVRSPSQENNETDHDSIIVLDDEEGDKARDVDEHKEYDVEAGDDVDADYEDEDSDTGVLYDGLHSITQKKSVSSRIPAQKNRNDESIIDLNHSCGSDGEIETPLHITDSLTPRQRKNNIHEELMIEAVQKSPSILCSPSQTNRDVAPTQMNISSTSPIRFEIHQKITPNLHATEFDEFYKQPLYPKLKYRPKLLRMSRTHVVADDERFWQPGKKIKNDQFGKHLQKTYIASGYDFVTRRMYEKMHRTVTLDMIKSYADEYLTKSKTRPVSHDNIKKYVEKAMVARFSMADVQPHYFPIKWMTLNMDNLDQFETLEEDIDRIDERRLSALMVACENSQNKIEIVTEGHILCQKIICDLIRTVFVMKLDADRAPLFFYDGNLDIIA